MSESKLNSDASADQPPLIADSQASEERKRNLEQSHQLYERMFGKLAELGITKVTIGFTGWNDNGRIEYMLTERSAANTGAALKEADFDGRSVYSALEEIICGQLDTQHEDWKTEDGASGRYTLDVTRRAVHEDVVVHETKARFVQQEDYEKWCEQLENRLFTRLAELGVAKLMVECEGGGDQGEIVSAEPTMDPGRAAPILEETEFEGNPIWYAIGEVVLIHLSADYPGWELDWGSDATYTLDVPEREVVCEAFVEFEEEEDDEEADGDKDDEAAGNDEE